MNVERRETAVFAGGCFWCMEEAFDHVDGVISTISGYTGGHVSSPTYQQVSAGGTGHVEALEVVYDPDKVSYQELLTFFWHQVDPLDGQGQFCDKGEQYRSVIFYRNEEQHRLAQASLQETSKRLGQKVMTDIRAATPFYPAEDYHQNYYLKHPLRYKFYRMGCGRDARLRQVWGGG